MSKIMTDEEAYANLLSEDGFGFTKSQLAEMVGISKQAVTRWKVIPARYLSKIHEKTGIPKRKLLPSLFT